MSAMRVDELRPYHLNARRGNVPVIAESLATLGQYRPIVVNTGTHTGRPFEVLAGNQTLGAAMRLGWTELDVHLVDVDDDTAARIVLIDNRANDLAVYDEDELRVLLDSLPSLEATGWSDEELATLRERTDAIGQGLVDPVMRAERPAEPVAAQSKWDGLPDEPIDETLPTPYGVETIAQVAFDFFRSQPFPLPTMPRHEALQLVNRLAQTPTDVLRQSQVASAVSDTYHPHRFSLSAGGISPAASFEDDESLRKAIDWVLESGGSVLNATMLRSRLAWVRGGRLVTRFRPGFALHLARRYAPPQGVWLDTCAGFGSSIVAFAASSLSRYVGIDPSTKTHAGNLALAADLAIAERVSLICKPAEDVALDEIGAGTCDFAFTSPPYFSKEQYADEETQSSKRYPDADAWREGFLTPMLRLQFDALRPQGISLVNIADVVIGSRTYPLEAWTKDVAGQLGFELLDVEEMPIARTPGAGTRPRSGESVFVFRKP